MTYDPHSPQFNQPLRRKRRAWPWILAAVLLVCGGGTIIAAAANSGQDTTKAAADLARAVPPAAEPSVQPHPDEPKPKAAAPAAVALGPGDYEVASTYDLATNRIKAGTYTVGADAGGHCYWERVKNWDGELGSIIANDNVEGTAKARVTVKKTDKGLHLGDGCLAAIKTK